MKVCPLCEQEKDLDDFYKRNSRKANEPQGYCKSCSNRLSRERNKALKIEAFEHYGGTSCFCCGVSEPAFLALDHENNDGAKHRKEIGGCGTRVYRWLKAHNWPDLKLRVSCHNCNIGRQINGICPHQVSVARSSNR